MFGLLFAGNMLLATAQVPECNAELCWSVSPAFCVAATVEQNCEAQLTVSWSSSKAENLCLYFAQQQMQCWQQAEQGQWQQELNWPGKTEVRLQNNRQVLLQKELIVLSRQPEKRRRLVAPWSVF
ncbi:DUF3019 domain-containing protein [Rheinheimera soli]|jgi:hypothetical protein|uniref:DUF3019 domain-containing protein n=1 Tax=Rheinheimera soli TaxID=443616 RepID=A0ABU1W1A0_9GAMM|nr:DUF3019 domain-containing protein [Rheinheimera soli]MDR7121738.1 hypothetical protein [Rheinheimera soli]